VVRDDLARGASLLSDAGVESPRLDAELLLGAVLGVSRTELVVAGRDALPDGVASRYDALLARRAAREPVAYVLGSKPFRRLSLAVDRRVLIPRPETELLVEIGLGLAPGARVADVGTGSGAVALALADERPDLQMTGIDLSADALTVARANGERLGLEVRFVQADLLDAGSSYDAVLANLPYVAAGTALMPEVALYEPAGALFAGDDGLDAIRRLLELLTGQGEVSLVALEIGFDQADQVVGLVAGAGFADVSRRRDLAGFERVIVGRR
jgi:release factor glutamine methyltransferase